MAQLHLLGLPRIGPDRELKWALEKYWRGDISAEALIEVGHTLRLAAWQHQADLGADLITVGDFSWYDGILDHSLMFNLIPRRFREGPSLKGFASYFALARGHQDGSRKLGPSPMLKWFDTNYHYLAPELDADSHPQLDATALLEQVGEARTLGRPVKVVLVGPVTLLWLSRAEGGTDPERLRHLEALTTCYAELLENLHTAGVAWVQLDEPALCTDLPESWRSAYERTYQRLGSSPVPLILATYFDGLRENMTLALQLPVAAVHIDLVRSPSQLATALDRLGPNKILSLGVIDGRNIWRADLNKLLATLEPVHERLGDRLWLSTSCSLLHVPYRVDRENTLPDFLRHGLAFAEEKQAELALLKAALNQPRDTTIEDQLASAASAVDTLLSHPERNHSPTRTKLRNISAEDRQRTETHAERKRLQQRTLKLPLLPTTTIGSFPQDQAIRQARKALRDGAISYDDYRARMADAITDTIRAQEALGLDVLVHGEPERTDMVEYFGERIEGFETTRHGWVQSYGSRCVKPPIIYGDCRRRTGLTLDWMAIARAATDKPLKGMLTGPVTLIAWSFVREDIPMAAVADQLALCLREEIEDLEALGITIAQVDEPALRELLPLRKSDQPTYMDWAIAAFRLATAGARASTQIHTHMCYSQFSDIMPNIKSLDADVITIEAARGELALVHDLRNAGYTADVGPGIYDIHTPLVPTQTELQSRLAEILQYLPTDQVWVNPDCGLKTRSWAEVKPALQAMVAAARAQREALTEKTRQKGVAEKV
ncbi:MAG: 5-methyltetrahydropteroyltriglutamate--homocysteine S-methyltransferase [Alteromonadaceae bacterium]|nr:5-methyltetrahydropteroyltriglutamate--homocysteine S-methyltransferase [Alteromonadaceae bacterium]